MPTIDELQARRDIPGLIEALKDKDGRIRLSAVKALGNLRDPRSVEPLTGMLSDDFTTEREVFEQTTVDEHIGSAAAEALARIGDTRAVGPLLAALKPDGVVKQWHDVYLEKTVYKALNSLTRESLFTNKDWLQWWEKNKEKPRWKLGDSERQKGASCWAWSALLLGGLLSIAGFSIGSIILYGQISGTSGNPGDIQSFFLAIGCFSLPLLIFGLGLLGVGIYTLRKKH